MVAVIVYSDPRLVPHAQKRAVEPSSFPEVVVAMADLAAAVQGHYDGTAKLHRYWVAGPGLAKWAHSPHPWQTLYDHLAKFIPEPDKLKRTVSAWHNEVMAPTGSDRYRMEHGGKIRGKVVGSG